MNRAMRRLAKKLEHRPATPPNRIHFNPQLDEWEQFDTVERMFQKLRNGAIEVEGNEIIIMGLHGETYRMLPALEGWMEYWSALARLHQVDYDDSALRKLAKSLEYDKPLTEREVDAAYLVVTAQRRMFRTIPRKSVAAVAIKVQESMRAEQEMLGA